MIFDQTWLAEFLELQKIPVEGEIIPLVDFSQTESNNSASESVNESLLCSPLIYPNTLSRVGNLSKLLFYWVKIRHLHTSIVILSEYNVPPFKYKQHYKLKPNLIITKPHTS
jgi:hypothetical protein